MVIFEEDEMIEPVSSDEEEKNDNQVNDKENSSNNPVFQIDSTVKSLIIDILIPQIPVYIDFMLHLEKKLKTLSIVFDIIKAYHYEKYIFDRNLEK